MIQFLTTFQKKDVKIYKKWDKKYKDDPDTNHQAR